MSLFKSSYYTDEATIEIISVNRAKERAAKKCNIPFHYGDEIDATGILKKNPKRVIVDTSCASQKDIYLYHKYMKKFKNQEFNRFINPLSESIVLTLPVITLATLAIVLIPMCSCKKEEKTTPRLIQKGEIKPVEKQTVHTR